ncbi:MAG: polyamine aminopropyltransferase, partial [Rectinema sp.]|nr:polyamine aminopropyltransferase [Rectinema sp.]
YEQLNRSSGFYYDVSRILASTSSSYQRIELAESPEFGRVLLLDGITQVAQRGEERYHETLVVPALAAHPNPERVLIIGGGDGGVLREVLAWRTVRKAVMVELDAAVVEFSRRYMPEISGGAFEDPRAELVIGDGREWVERCPDHEYDVVIMDMTDPFGPSEALYTQEFFSEVRRVLRGETGLFAMHGESPIARPAAYACIHKTLREIFPYVNSAFAFVPMYGTLWSFKVAGSLDSVLKLLRLSLRARNALLEKRSGMLRFARPALWPALFAEDPAASEALQHPDSRIITDKNSQFPDTFFAETAKN